MSLPLPRLDDKTWQVLRDEGVQQIPRFQQEWDDHNAHDPGITFIELFAWLAEILQFRTEQVSDESARRLLTLVGVKPRGPRPASAALRVDLDGARSGALIPAGTPVVPVGRDEIAFETVADHFLNRISIGSVITVCAGRRIDQTEANRRSDTTYFPLGRRGASDTVFEVLLDGHFDGEWFHLFVTLADEALPTVAAALADPSAELAWEAILQGRWRPFSPVRDETAGLRQSGRITFPVTESIRRESRVRLRVRVRAGHFEIPPRFEAISPDVLEVVQLKSVINEDLGEGDGSPWQCRTLARSPVHQARSGPLLDVGEIIDRPAFLETLLEARGRVAARARSSIGAELLARLADLRTRCARSWDAAETRLLFCAVQLLNERLKTPVDACRNGCPSAGHTDERQALEKLFAGSLRPAGRLRLESADPLPAGSCDSPEWNRWLEVSDFDGSGPRDRHYLLDADEGRICFGNGVNGRRPAAGERLRARFYQTSRFDRGNLRGGLHWDLRLGTLRWTVLNQRPASGGRAAESIERARQRAHALQLERQRAITARDAETLALRTPGLRVARAHAYPGVHPSFCGHRVPGVLTLVVVPQRREGDPRPPLPARPFLETVRRFLESRRLVTTDLHVVAPTPVEVRLEVSIRPDPRADRTRTRERIEAALRAFLDPLRGGPAGEGWPAGRDLFPAEIYQVVDSVRGVEAAWGLRINGGAVDEAATLVFSDLPGLTDVRLRWDDGGDSRTDRKRGGRR